MILLKAAYTLIIVIGLLVIVWNFKAADDGDKKAKKWRNIGFVMFIAGVIACLFLPFLGV